MSEGEVASRGDRRAVALLAVGAAVGIALAVANLLSGSGGRSLAEGAAASVNGVPIRMNQYERALAALASDRRSPLDAADRRHILDRLIDEELLVQYGLSLGLAERDRRVRSDLVSAVLASQVASVDGAAPSEAEVAAFYRENEDFFRAPGRYRVRSLSIRSSADRAPEDALLAAQSAVERLRAGESFELVAQSLGDRPVAPVPDAMLPPAKLREYIGPTALGVVAALEVGEVSEPLELGATTQVLMLVDRELASSPPLEDVRNEVMVEMRRRAGDDAVRNLLDRLREGAALEIADSVE